LKSFHDEVAATIEACSLVGVCDLGYAFFASHRFRFGAFRRNMVEFSKNILSVKYPKADGGIVFYPADCRDDFSMRQSVAAACRDTVHSMVLLLGCSSGIGGSGVHDGSVDARAHSVLSIELTRAGFAAVCLLDRVCNRSTCMVWKEAI
jgi:hypothetical protein